MKNNLFLFMSLLLLFACSEQKQTIEIIPNYEKEYYEKKDVDFTAECVSPEEISRINSEVLEIIKRGTPEEDTNSVHFFLKYNLFIDESGKIEKVKILENSYFSSGSIEAKEIRNLQKEINDHEIIAKMSNWNYLPAKKDGENVKSILEWQIRGIINPNGNAEIINNKITDINQDDFLEVVDTMPFPIGGMAAIAGKVIYPELAKRAGITGRVYVNAFVDESGNVIHAEIIKGIGGGCDSAAINAVSETLFSPGLKNNIPVKVKITIPILFKLN